LPEIRLEELAKKLHGRVKGDPAVIIKGVAGLEEAKEGDISFVANPRYHNWLSKTQATAVIIGESNGAVQENKNYIIVENPYLCFMKTVELFYPPKSVFKPGIHSTAVVDPTAKIGERVHIGPLVVVGTNSRIGNDVVLEARSYVGDRVVIGDKTRVMPGATILEDVTIGKRCLLQSGCVLGGDGFGFVCDRKGVQKKIPQVSGLVIGDDVEVGANTTIDRGTLSPTRIGNGVKFDNLVHVAHNVEIGDNTLVIAQVGISGSTKIGSSVILGGQVGIAGHLQIGDRAKIGAKTGITKSVPSGVELSGHHGRPITEALRAEASLHRLPKVFQQIRELMRKVKEIEEKTG